MPKEIRCVKCDSLVAVLEKGSKWKTGSLVLCPKHTDELVKNISFSNIFGSNSENGTNIFSSMFGGVL